LICPSSQSEAFIIAEFRGYKVSFSAKVLAAAGDGCTADILKEVEELCAWIALCVTGDGTNVLLQVLGEMQHEYSL
jgi:hypothetical protein